MVHEGQVHKLAFVLPYEECSRGKDGFLSGIFQKYVKVQVLALADCGKKQELGKAIDKPENLGRKMLGKKI